LLSRWNKWVIFSQGTQQGGLAGGHFCGEEYQGPAPDALTALTFTRKQVWPSPHMPTFQMGVLVVFVIHGWPYIQICH
jgi:hypothetical protein